MRLFEGDSLAPMGLPAGITDGLVRVSIGCKDADDIIADFDRALG